MKNNRLLKALMLVLVTLAWTSCHKDKEIEGKDPVVSNEEMTVSSTEARFSWCVDFTGQFQTGVEVSQNENMTDVRRVEATKQEEKFVAVVSDLSMGKKYYYRIVVWNKFNNYEEEVKNFTTTQTFAVNLACLPEEGGTAMGGGTFAAGDTCTVTAVASEGFTFAKWTESGNQVSTEAEYSFEVTGDRNLVANFNSSEYTITATADPETAGTVSGGGEYSYGNECTLKATANDGYTFVNWTENGEQVSSDVNYSFTVSCSRDLVAHFTSQAYVIHVYVDPENGGTVTGAQGYNYGDECTLRAIPAEGFSFAKWTEGSNEISVNPYTFSVTSSHEFVAHFQAINYNISVSANPNEGGTVSGGGDFHYGEECTVTATDEAGYTFSNWTENGNVVSESANYTFTVTCNRTLVANFTLEQYTITTSVDPMNSGTVTGGGAYNHGDPCTLKATANNNAQYEFDHWTKNDLSYFGESTIDFTVTESATYTAHFRLRRYTITALSYPTYGGNVTGSGTYDYGTNVNLTANPNANFTFDHWQDNNTTNPRTITVTGNATYTAYFFEQPQFPAGAINGKFTINPNGDQVYFSQGNLQYIGSTQKWKFADHQWEVIGTSQGSNSQTITRDLFGWGTSGWSDSGATYYRPWDTDKSNGSLYGPPGQHNLTGTYSDADWGVHNPISNGGGLAGQWRTLTKDEWHCVFDTREASTVNGTANARYVKAKVNDMKGVILFPDNYTHPSGVEQPVGINQPGTMGWNENNYSATDFGLMENNGAVFLPATGTRDGTTVGYVGEYGFYWSTSCHTNNSNLALFVLFIDDEIMQDYYYRYVGQSVRLVCPAGN